MTKPPLDAYLMETKQYENLARRIIMPKVEIYRSEFSEAEASLYRVNCFINIDDNALVEGFVKECVLRSLGLLGPAKNISTQNNLLEYYLDKRPDVLGRSDVVGPLAKDCLSQLYGVSYDSTQ